MPYRVGGRSSRRAIRENAELAAEVAALGMAMNVSPAQALTARVAGYVGQEQEFSRRLQYQLLTGDATGLADVVEQFNQQACVPPDTVVCRPFAPVRVAVGN